MNILNSRSLDKVSGFVPFKSRQDKPRETPCFWGASSSLLTGSEEAGLVPLTVRTPWEAVHLDSHKPSQLVWSHASLQEKGEERDLSGVGQEIGLVVGQGLKYLWERNTVPRGHRHRGGLNTSGVEHTVYGCKSASWWNSSAERSPPPRAAQA